MPRITVDITEDEQKILKKRANKNFLSLAEQAEDIIRRSCISQKNKSSAKEIPCDDKLVSIFSRAKRGSQIKR
ncbi:MAG TPA: hypothetical protein VJ438_04235 [Candidatus Nanoarchaeia archaeon]|nr:hypothetical protein [Candidatus Nanoarchaeia archaeon]